MVAVVNVGFIVSKLESTLVKTTDTKDGVTGKTGKVISDLQALHLHKKS